MVKLSIDIKDDLDKDIKDYCNLNNVDINSFLSKAIESGYLIEKYGLPVAKIEKESTKQQKDEPRIRDIAEPSRSKGSSGDIYGE